MSDEVIYTVKGIKDDPGQINPDHADTTAAMLVQAMIDSPFGFERANVTIKPSGHDDIEGPERTGDDFDPVVPS